MFLLFLSFFVFVSSTDYKNCELDCRLACLKIVHEIGENERTGGQSDEAIEKTSKLCSEYRKCAEGMKFKASDEMIGHIDRLLVLCDVNDFSKSYAFKACGAKMEANKSTCYREWIPFPDRVEDQKKMEEIQKEACKNFFGKDNCIEKEITDICGLGMWKLYKKHSMALNSVSGACKFD